MTKKDTFLKYCFNVIKGEKIINVQIEYEVKDNIFHEYAFLSVRTRQLIQNSRKQKEIRMNISNQID
jgi:hypothetical protein